MQLINLAIDLATATIAFLALFVIFRPRERKNPAWPEQPFFRDGWITDLCFFLGHYLFWVAFVLGILAELIPWLHSLVPLAVRRAVGCQPFFVQFVEVVLLGDFLIYWGHRLQHRVDWLWRFHSVHHSSQKLDWLAAHREHPLDTIYSVTLMNLPVYMLGFSTWSMGCFVTFRGLWAIFIHCNVRVSLGPLGLLFGSPAFHHWHHDRDRHSCNFGNVSPLMDVIFGTHYDPGHEPETLGLREPTAQGYVGLLLNPFLPRALRIDAPNTRVDRVSPAEGVLHSEAQRAGFLHIELLRQPATWPLAAPALDGGTQAAVRFHAQQREPVVEERIHQRDQRDRRLELLAAAGRSVDQIEAALVPGSLTRPIAKLSDLLAARLTFQGSLTDTARVAGARTALDRAGSLDTDDREPWRALAI